MPSNVICLVNFKGGVGKTSVAVNLSATLAHDPFNKKVLLIDLDAQANASIWTMGLKKWQTQVLKNSQNTVFQIFQDKHFGASGFKFKNAVVKNPFHLGLAPNLDLLPSTYKMMAAEDLLWRIKPDIPVQYLVRDALEPYLGGYDLVVIDCPPNTYRVTQNAIAMSRFIFVPCTPDFLSLVGLSELVRRLEQIGGILGAHAGKVIPIRGVIINRFRSGLLATAAGVATLTKAVKDLRNEGALLPNCEVLEPKIKETTAFAQAADFGVPIFGIKAPIAADPIQQYKELAEKMVGIMEI